MGTQSGSESSGRDIFFEKRSIPLGGLALFALKPLRIVPFWDQKVVKSGPKICSLWPLMVRKQVWLAHCAAVVGYLDTLFVQKSHRPGQFWDHKGVKRGPFFFSTAIGLLGTRRCAWRWILEKRVGRGLRYGCLWVVSLVAGSIFFGGRS